MELQHGEIYWIRGPLKRSGGTVDSDSTWVIAQYHGLTKDGHTFLPIPDDFEPMSVREEWIKEVDPERKATVEEIRSKKRLLEQEVEELFIELCNLCLKETD